MQVPTPYSITPDDRIPPSTTYRTVYPGYVGLSDFDARIQAILEARAPFFRSRSWIDFDFVAWRLSSMRTPPLVTRNDAAGIGALGEEGTTVLLGNNGLNPGMAGGMRLRFGTWIDDERTWGIEAAGFMLDQALRSRYYGSDNFGFPQLSRPVYFAGGGGEGVVVISNPNALKGGLYVDTAARVAGGELNFVWLGVSNDRVHAELIAGFRYLDLEEDLAFSQAMQTMAATPAFGTVLPTGSGISLFDYFGTTNRFYGGQVGGRIDWIRGRWTLDVTGKIALGGTEQHLGINGQTRISTPSGPSFFTGGVLATSSNIGQYNGSAFSVVPEFGLNIGYQLTPQLRLKLGYTLLYWSNVVRPGPQIDRTVNPGLVPLSSTYGSAVSPARPEMSFNRSDFWAEGINLGLEFRF